MTIRLKYGLLQIRDILNFLLNQILLWVLFCSDPMIGISSMTQSLALKAAIIIIIIIIIASARSFTIQLWETCISQQRYHDDEPFGYSSTGEWWTQPSLFTDSIISTCFSFDNTEFKLWLRSLWYFPSTSCLMILVSLNEIFPRIALTVLLYQLHCRILYLLSLFTFHN